MTVFAHAGHWLVSLVYAAPVVVLIVYIGIDRFRHRGEEDEENDENEAAVEPRADSPPETSTTSSRD